MSNIHPHRIHRFITAAFLVTGILVTIISTKSLLSAKLNGVGTTHVEIEGSEELLPVAAHFAASVSEDDLTPILVGMLLVLAGFSFHALYVVRHQDPVHFTVTRESARRRTRRSKR